jgi:predicted Zn-dependent peptidase
MIELELRNVIFFGGGKPVNLEKNSRSKGENQQQTQLTYDVESGDGTRYHSGERRAFMLYATHASHNSFREPLSTQLVVLNRLLIYNRHGHVPTQPGYLLETYGYVCAILPRLTGL